MGAIQNRLLHTIYNIQSIRSNMIQSRGRKLDTDYAEAVPELAKQEVLREAAIANMIKSDELMRSVLRLLRSQ